MALRVSSDQDWALAVARAKERTDAGGSPGRIKVLVTAWGATLAAAFVVGLLALSRGSSYGDALGFLGLGLMLVGFVVGGVTYRTA